MDWLFGSSSRPSSSSDRPHPSNATTNTTVTFTIQWVHQKGKPIQVTMDTDQTTLRTLKEHLSRTTGVPVDHIRLMLAGAVLKRDEMKLKGFGIRQGSRIMMMGSPPPPSSSSSTAATRDDRGKSPPTMRKDPPRTSLKTGDKPEVQIHRVLAALAALEPTFLHWDAMVRRYWPDRISTDAVDPQRLRDLLQSLSSTTQTLSTPTTSNIQEQEESEQRAIYLTRFLSEQLTRLLLQLDSIVLSSPPPSSDPPSSSSNNNNTTTTSTTTTSNDARQQRKEAVRVVSKFAAYVDNVMECLDDVLKQRR